MSDIDFANFLSDDKSVDADNDKETKTDKTQPSGDELKLDDATDDEDEDDNEVIESDPEDESIEDDTEEKPKELKLDDEDEDVNLSIPNRQKILKDFPDLFKKHPSIEKAIYREQQYAEVFPHPKDAEEAKASIGILANIESELGQGNIENLLSSVKRFDEKAFNQITENFLPTLQKLNQPAYIKTVNYVLKSALHQASEFGKTEDKDSDQYQIGLAARILNKWIYNTADVKAPDDLSAAIKTENPKEKEIEDRERRFHQQALSGAVQEVDDRIISTLTRSIESSIDPKNLMTPYIKSNATKDVLSQFRDDLKKDKRFSANLDRLWKNCREDNYSEKSKSKIREAIKNQAKQVLPDIMRRVKADALKDYKKVEKREHKEERPVERRRPSANNNSSSPKKGEKFRLPDGKTAREFLLED